MVMGMVYGVKLQLTFVSGYTRRIDPSMLSMDVIASIKERQDALGRATRHVLTRVAKCIDVDGGMFENVLY
jgi:hypothetical protein